MKKITFLFALLCASVMGFATQYCNTLLTSGNTGDRAGNVLSDDVYFTATKTGDNETTFSITSTSRTLTGEIFDNQALMQNPGGGTLDGNFAEGWTFSDNTLTKVATWTTYPTGNIQVYIVVKVQGSPDITGAQILNVDVSAACGSTPEPTVTTFNIHEVWPAERVIASKSGDDFNVNIASYGGGQWSAQLKLEHNVSFENTKAYKIAYTLTADKDCGGITFKTDDNNGAVYENQSINLTANTPYHYEKVFSGLASNNKITVFDFGWVGASTNITISDLTLEEYSPATASSTNGDLIPFKAVDGNAGTRWQAASTGEQWWKMDYGTAQSFNRVNITWEASYAKSFTIQGSNDDETYTTLATISGQTISTFPFKQVIDLSQIYNYRYVKFVGTENGNGYGFSFYEFEILETEISVLTDVVITSPKRKTVCAVGQSIDITAIARDQYEEPMAGQTITYTVSPAAKGTIDANGHYTASQVGEVTITATCSDKSATATVVNTISGNLALNKTATAGDGETPIGNANDNNLNSYWSLGPNKTSDKWWWQVDLEETYDLSLVIIKWEGACPTEHAIQVSTDATNWTDAATLSGWPEIGGDNDHNYQFYSISNTARYIRVMASALREVGWGMKIYDFQAFGTVAASPTKNVSATPNDPAMGTATVKQFGADVTKVETGSTVTFSAVANEGYIFVEWSNGEKAATFDAVVNATMNLTATFRALNHISCNEEMTNGDYTVYVTYRKTANENEYEFIVRSAKVMTNFSNAYIGHINGNNQVNLNGQGSLSADGHKLSYTFTSTTEPKLNTPLYVNFANHGEVTFNQIDHSTVFEFAIACADPEITAIELDKTEATLDMGNTLTLKPSFTPAYMSADITWQTSDDTKATVVNGVVTPVAAGNVTITAKVTEDIKATCTVTVQNAASHNWYGYGTSQDLDYTYRIEYTTDHHIVAHVKRQGDKTGLVNAAMLISGDWTTINVTEGEEDGWKKGTTEATFTTGDNIHILIQSAYAGPTSIIEFDYEVGADNVMPTIVPSVLKLNTNEITMGVYDADIQLTTEIHHRDAANQNITWTSDDESVATVENGMVHPVGVGSTIIHASTFNGVSESCDVTVVGELEPATFWGNGTSNGVAIAYSITRNSNHTLTYAVEALQDKEGFVVRINDGGYHDATLNEGIYTWTSEATYIDGAVFSGFIYMPFTGGDARVDFVNYVVGSESARKYVPVTLAEENNSFVISHSDNVIRDVELTRTFPNTDEWYTICLPFDLSAEQLTEAFGPGYTIAEMVSAEDRGSLIHLNFDYAPAFLAGKAYLLRPGIGVTAASTFEGVTVKNVDPATLKSANDYMEFQGTFEYTTLDQANQRFVGPENYLYTPDPNGTHMKAFRCYFTIPSNSVLSGAPAKPARIVFGPQATTGIDEVEEDGVKAKIMVDGVLYIIRDGKTYNAQGMLVK